MHLASFYGWNQEKKPTIVAFKAPTDAWQLFGLYQSRNDEASERGRFHFFFGGGGVAASKSGKPPPESAARIRATGAHPRHQPGQWGKLLVHTGAMARFLDLQMCNLQFKKGHKKGHKKDHKKGHVKPQLLHLNPLWFSQGKFSVMLL